MPIVPSATNHLLTIPLLLQMEVEFKSLAARNVKEK